MRSLFLRNQCLKVKVAQLYLTLCDPMYYTVHGILQARMLDELPFPSLEDLPDPGIEPMSPALAGEFFTTEPAGKSFRGKVLI